MRLAVFAPFSSSFRSSTYSVLPSADFALDCIKAFRTRPIGCRVTAVLKDKYHLIGIFWPRQLLGAVRVLQDFQNLRQVCVHAGLILRQSGSVERRVLSQGCGDDSAPNSQSVTSLLRTSTSSVE